jgi:hypothetical protein
VDERQIILEEIQAALAVFEGADILVPLSFSGLRAIIPDGTRNQAASIRRLVKRLVPDGTCDWREVVLGDPEVGPTAKLAVLELNEHQLWRVLQELGLSGNSTIHQLTAKTRDEILGTREGRVDLLDRLIKQLDDLGWRLAG